MDIRMRLFGKFIFLVHYVTPIFKFFPNLKIFYYG
jgi:hypothetical protein